MNNNFTYKIIRIPLKQGFWDQTPIKDYKKVIDEWAQRGWRFVQVVSPPIGFYGTSKFFDVVFEKQIPSAS